MAFGRSRPSANAGQQFDNTNTGILFENNRKGGNPKAPDFRGSINIDGRDYWLSGWEKETKRGPALSLSVEPKQEARRDNYERDRDSQRPIEPRRDSRPPLNDDLPPGWE